MPIRWKVVTEGRQSIITKTALAGYDYQETELLTRIYRVGKVVTAHEKSIGLLTFSRKKDAKFFAGVFHITLPTLKVIKVKGLGRGERINQLLCDSHALVDFLHELKGDDSVAIAYGNIHMEAPHNTIAYKSVKVLT